VNAERARILQQAGRRASRALKTADAAARDRNELIREAVRAGESFADVARAVGVTKARVQQIVEAGR